MTLTKDQAEALRQVVAYMAKEYEDMAVYVMLGGKPENHIAHYVTILDGLLDAYYDTQLQGESK